MVNNKKCTVPGCSGEGNLNGISETHYKRDNCPYLKKENSETSELEYDWTEENRDHDFNQILASDADCPVTNNSINQELCVIINQRLVEYKKKHDALEEIIDNLNEEKESIILLNSTEQELKKTKIEYLETEVNQLKAQFQVY